MNPSAAAQTMESTETFPKLGIIAGSGDLPVRLIDACVKTGREVFVLAFENETDQFCVQDVPHAWMRLGAIGQAIQTLRQAGVGELVLAGRIRRPSIAQLRPDLA